MTQQNTPYLKLSRPPTVYASRATYRPVSTRRRRPSRALACMVLSPFP